MLVRRIVPVLLLTSVCCLISCSETKKKPKYKVVPVVPVKGTITVDGKPEADLQVTFLPLGTFEPMELSKTLTRSTNAEGKYVMGTYEIGDGLPVGDYAITVTWIPFEITMGNGPQTVPKDKLGGKYKTVDGSPKTVKVEAGKPLEIETIDLKTQ